MATSTSAGAPGPSSFPIDVEGALLSLGDVHFRQGDGEVCGTAIETHGRVRLRCEVLPAASLRHAIDRPLIEAVEPAREGGRRYVTIPGLPLHSDGSNGDMDLTASARDAVLRMIDWLTAERGLSREQAYVLCSVAVDLRISEIVDVPNPWSPRSVRSISSIRSDRADRGT